ncbi:integrase [Chryseobacterium angstadtii]|uniref:Integrase n=1 Tax=Chryseobacterium angstadtii TaxID=558151 RepID=A0A0J7IEZ1_9FLAO|nr:site-specific integrase [Chryseobacterium angstadtii]KMQ64564.1 integrase [Chryseobacterium angstadtii]
MEKTKRSTFKLLFYLKKNAVKKNGTVSIMGRITINGQVSQFSTKLEITAEQWDLKFGRVSGKSREATEANQKLDKIRLRIDQCYGQILEKQGYVTAEKLKNALLGTDDEAMTLFSFLEKFNSDFEKKKESGLKSYNTYRKYVCLFNHLKAFSKHRYSKDDISFNEVDCGFVQEFDFYLRNDLGLSHNTIWMYMIALTTVAKLAIRRKHLASNPFDEYRNTKKDRDRGYLLRKELEQLIEYQPLKKNQEFMKDMFVFSCFTGLSYSDIRLLDKSNIQDFFDGNTWIITRRKKTVVPSNVMLLDIPKLIIAKYEGIARNGKLFPMLTNSHCNDVLQEMCKNIECLKHKRVTFHLARHTFATLFLTEGVPLESISKMMGHKNIATTQIYAKILNEKVGRDMAKVSQNFKGLEASLNGGL